MPPPSSSFLRTGQPDPRLAQSASTPFDATARQVLDQQVVDVQTLLAQLHANGIVGSYVQIDPTSSVDVSKGDVLCRSGVLTRNSALVADAANLAAAGSSVLGVALEAVAKGSRCPYAALGPLPPEVTGLPSGPALVRVSATGRPEVVGSYGPGDVPLGSTDGAGWLTVSLGAQPPTTNTGVYFGALTTTDATPTPILEIPFSDNAIVTGSLYGLVVDVPGGFYLQTSSFGTTISVSAGGAPAQLGTPVPVTSTTFVGPQPSFDVVYAANVLTFRAIGLVGSTLTWKMRFDPLSVLA